MENKDDLYSNILSDGPSPSTLFLILSRMKKTGQLKEVIQECLKALSIYPNDIYIRRLLAEIYFEEGQLSQAEAELDKVIARINDLISCYSLQARIFLQQGKESEALASLKLYLSHRPNDQTALNLFNQLQTTLTPFKEEGLPDIDSVTLAETHFDQGRIEEAVETYERIIAQNPDNITLRERLDEIKGIMGKMTEDRRKEKIISILESWLSSLREGSKAGLNENII